MKKLLITGYDPFGGATINPAWEAVKLLPDQVGSCRLHKLEIPTVFEEAAGRVIQEAEQLCPDVILCIGQASGRGAVTPERLAINLRDASIADNAGRIPVDEPIEAKGPAAIFSTLPVKNMVRAIGALGIPAALSNTAGTFVCNETLYLLLHRYEGTHVRVGFIHVPWLPEQGNPSLPVEQTAKALAAAIEAI